MSAAPPKRKVRKAPSLKCSLLPGDDSHFSVSIPYGKGASVKEQVKTHLSREVVRFNDVFPGRWSVHKSYAPKLVSAGILHPSKDVNHKVLAAVEKFYQNRTVKDDHYYTEFKALDPATFDPKDIPLAHALYGFQNAGVRSLVPALSEGGALLADEMGLGKSLQAIASAIALGQRLVVVAPASLLFNWASEIFKHSPGCRVHIHNLRSTSSALAGTFGDDHRKFTDIIEQADVVITSYDSAKTFCENLPEELQGPDEKVIISPYYRELFQDRIAVVDEAHYAKNLNAGRTQAVLALSRVVKDTLVMTGTPILNRPAELWPLLLLAKREKEIAPDWFAYEQWYVKNGQYIDLNSKLENANWFVRRLKKDVLTDLPDKQRGELRVTMASVYENQYRAARQGLSRKGLKMANALAILTELQTIANEAKIDSVCDYLLERSNACEQTVVQCTRSAAIIQLADQLRRKGVTVALVYGATSKDERKRLEAAFQRGDIDVFLTTVGEGLTLTAADTLLLLDLDWNPGKINQREDRIHRIGQISSKVKVYRVIAASIDRHKVDIVAGKQEMISCTLDGGRTHDAMETTMQEQVIERLKEENEQE